MKKLSLATAVFAATVSLVAVNANAYQVEVGAKYTYLDLDNNSGSVDGFGVDGTYHFAPVNTNKGPLNEAGFLNKSSNIAAHYQFMDSGDDDVKSYGAKVEYYVPQSNFYVSGGINQLDFDVSDITSYTDEIGYLPIPNLLLAAGVFGYDTDADDDIDPSIRAKYLTQVGNNTVNFEASATLGDTDYYNIGADVYLDPTLSLGASWGKPNPLTDSLSAAAAGTDEETFSIKAKKFFTQQASLEGSVGFGDDATIFGIRGAYRF